MDITLRHLKFDRGQIGRMCTTIFSQIQPHLSLAIFSMLNQTLSAIQALEIVVGCEARNQFELSFRDSLLFLIGRIFRGFRRQTTVGAW